ncbi:MAG: hypothetical protein ACLFUB_01135 [Cyclobacteriaceae bacterium]
MKNQILFIFAFICLSSCGGKDFQKTPVDQLITEMRDVPMYSIMLYDMNVEGTFFQDYQHQYRILKQSSPEAEPEEIITPWYDVSEEYFSAQQNNLGMEIAAKGEDGKISKTVSPPGYNNYVGNSRYGYWQDGPGGNSFWAFYGQYAFLSSMLNLATFPVRRSYYNEYRDYSRSGRPYYGPMVNNRRAYGTGSAYTSAAKPNSTWRSNRSSSTSFRSGQRTTRSGSRYSGSSSMRSRGGGFGK